MFINSRKGFSSFCSSDKDFLSALLLENEDYSDDFFEDRSDEPILEIL